LNPVGSIITEECTSNKNDTSWICSRSAHWIHIGNEKDIVIFTNAKNDLNFYASSINLDAVECKQNEDEVEGLSSQENNI